MTDDTCQCGIFQASVISLIQIPQLGENCWVCWEQRRGGNRPGYESTERWSTAGLAGQKLHTMPHLCQMCYATVLNKKKNKNKKPKNHKVTTKSINQSINQTQPKAQQPPKSTAECQILQRSCNLFSLLKSSARCFSCKLRHYVFFLEWLPFHLSFLMLLSQLLSNIKLPYTAFPLNAIPVLYLIL